MARKYTEFQQKAICAEGTDICVAAGAGSGKTGVLVERFVRLLTRSKSGELPHEEQAGVENILVFTFTEKATKEMKERIVAELNRLGMTEERRQIETAYISTIHGFCSRLLQENPFDAGVDPQFKVLDTTQERRLRRRAFEDVIARAYAEGDTEITELIAAAQSARQFGGEGDSLHVLAVSVETVLSKLRGAGKSLKETRRHWQSGMQQTYDYSNRPVLAFLAPLLHEISACIAGFEALRSGIVGTMSAACRTVEERALLFDPATTHLEQTLSAMEETLKAIKNARPRAANPTTQELQLFSLFQRIKIVCEAAQELFGLTAEREEQAALTAYRLWGLTVQVWQEYDTLKRRRGVLDNDDLQAEGVRLLEESPHVRAHYRGHFRHLMVDEFQDTNPLQMRLVDLLHSPEYATQAEKAQGRKVPNRLFVVGDVQQSIYGFRHADSTLFRSLERRYREQGEGLHVPLSVNFRSRPEILQVVEQVFRQIWRDEPTPFVPLTPGSAFEDKPAPSLEILVSQDLPRRDYVCFEADALAARVQQLVESETLKITSQSDPRCGEPIAYRDVAILLRALTDIQKYEEAFTRRGVPYFVVGGGRGYYARHEIRDLSNILTVLDTPLDDVAFAATLRSPFLGVDTDTLYRIAQQAGQPLPGEEATAPRSRNARPLYTALLELLENGGLSHEIDAQLAEFIGILEHLRTLEDRLPIGHLLERLVVQTHYDARLLCRPGGRRRLANVRKLMQMANSDPVMGVQGFLRRLKDLERLSDREGEAPTEEEAADVVRFITIHGAKGLEFPVVVLADLSRGLIMQERGHFVCDPQQWAIGTKLGGEPNVVYKAIDKMRRQADEKEMARLLYVAMTRAREHLVLCGNLGRNMGLNWGDSLFRLLALLDAPTEPTTMNLTGGIAASVAPLSHYVHAPNVQTLSASTAVRRQTEERAQQLADALLTAEI